MTTSTRSMSAAKKGDVEEVRAQLKDRSLDSDPAKKLIVLQRVIALMTMGIDTSSLFADVIVACFTLDLVSKKLIYFYLTTQSERNPDLAILSINTFLKECSQESPLVRGLALRSLSLLKGVPQLYDYLLPALKQGLNDRAAYVRSIAVLCTMTVFRSAPHTFIEAGFYDQVLLMLRDHDPKVCANALEVLLEIADFDKKWEEEQDRLLALDEEEAEEENVVANGTSPLSPSRRAARHRRGRGRAGERGSENAYEPSQHTPFLITKRVLYHLLNHLSGLNEWQQTQIVNLVQQYTPASEEEMFDIMNVLEDRLTGMHSGLVLSCCHAFIHLTQNHPTVHAQVLDRIRQPLLMLLTCSHSTESAYAILCHLKLLVKRSPGVYARAYKAFFCRCNEPSYVKAVKVDILAAVADPQSATLIIEELAAVAEDRNLIIARKAVAALGTIALRMPDMARPILNRFLESVSIGIKRVRGATLVVVTRLLRKYRDVTTARPFIAAVLEAHRLSPFLDEDSRVSLAWLLGEFGESVDDAPYILDALSDNLLEESAAFRLQILTSAVTLFFKRPPEMQALLGRIFDVLVNDFSNADVLDRAMMYYRLLKESPTTAAHVICCPKRPIGTFVEDQDTDVVDKLFFEEFDSLSVVYGLTAERFAAQRGLAEDDDDGDDEDDDAEGSVSGSASSGNSRRREEEEEEEDVLTARGDMLLQPRPSSDQQALGLLENRQGGEESSGNFLAKMFGNPAKVISSLAESTGATSGPYAAPAGSSVSPGSPSSPPPAAAAAAFHLSDEIEMEAPEFQRQWADTPTQATLTLSLGRVPEPETLEDFLEDNCVFTLASGGQGGSLKLYLFAQASGVGMDAFRDAADESPLFLVECVVASDGAARVTVKSRSPRGKDFATHLQGLMRQFCA